MSFTIWKILDAFLTSIIYTFPMVILCGIKLSKKSIYIVLLPITAILSLVTFTNPLIYSVGFVLSICIIFFLLSKNNVNISSVLLSIFVTFLLQMIVDSIIVFVVVNIFHKDFNIVKSNPIQYYSLNVILDFFTILGAYITRKFVIEKFSSPIFKEKSIQKLFNIISTLLLILLIIIISIINICFSNATKLSSVVYLSFTIALIILIVISCYLIYETLKSLEKQTLMNKENKQLKAYTDVLESASKDLRSFKHDYLNILYTLQDYINKGDIEELRKYFKNEILPESKIMTDSNKFASMLGNLKVLPLKSLLCSKLFYADSKKIKINVEIIDEINEIDMKTFDLCRIMGIFLDNAIEAAILCDNKFINIAFIKNNDDIIIVIMNSCMRDCPPVYKLYKTGFSTKGSNRGIGLASVKELIDTKYDNVLLSTNVCNGIFKHELIIKKGL